jgi:hypothetical protein
MSSIRQEWPARHAGLCSALTAAAGKDANVLTLHFAVPLAKPVLADAPDFTVMVGDPSFFIAFEPAATDPIKLGPGAPTGCRAGPAAAKAEVAKPGRAGDLMTPTPMLSDGLSFVAAPEWKVVCGPPA